jgi:hypothetical protein
MSFTAELSPGMYVIVSTHPHRQFVDVFLYICRNTNDWRESMRIMMQQTTRRGDKLINNNVPEQEVVCSLVPIPSLRGKMHQTHYSQVPDHHV